MKRRTFIIVGTGALAYGSVHLASAQDPTTAVKTSSLSEPIVIDAGLTIVDQSIRTRSDGSSVFVGEIQHDRSEVFDTPSFIQTFLDADGNVVGEGRIFGVVGFMRPGESDFLVGRYDDGFDPSVDDWDSYVFKYTNGDWPGQLQIQYTWNPGIDIAEISSEQKTADGYSAVVDGINVSGIDMTGGTCTVAVRDSAGHFVGYSQDRVESTIPAGKKARFRPEVSRDSGDTYNPFEFIDKGEAFTVEIKVSGRAY